MALWVINATLSRRVFFSLSLYARGELLSIMALVNMPRHEVTFNWCEISRLLVHDCKIMHCLCLEIDFSFIFMENHVECISFQLIACGFTVILLTFYRIYKSFQKQWLSWRQGNQTEALSTKCFCTIYIIIFLIYHVGIFLPFFLLDILCITSLKLSRFVYLHHNELFQKL